MSVLAYLNILIQVPFPAVSEDHKLHEIILCQNANDNIRHYKSNHDKSEAIYWR